MAHGYIKSDGTIDTRYAFSNDFTVDKRGDGHYRITFSRWMGSRPVIDITPKKRDPSHSHNATFDVTAFELTDGSTVEQSPTYADFYLSVDDNLRDLAFAFEARFDRQLVFDATDSTNSTLTLEPSIITYGGTKVFKLTTSIKLKVNGIIVDDWHVDLDPATVLLGVGNSLTIELSTNQVDDDKGNSWALSGYTYNNTAGDSGTAWTNNNTTRPSTELALDGTGPDTSPEDFIIVATPPSGSRLSILTSDPVVRLSNVPPAGMTL